MRYCLRSLVGPAMLALMLTACSPAPPEKTVFDDQLEALDRAREVEKKLQDRAERIGNRIVDEREVDETENEDPPQ